MSSSFLNNFIPATSNATTTMVITIGPYHRNSFPSVPLCTYNYSSVVVVVFFVFYFINLFIFHWINRSMNSSREDIGVTLNVEAAVVTLPWVPSSAFPLFILFFSQLHRLLTHFASLLSFLRIEVFLILIILLIFFSTGVSAGAVGGNEKRRA